MEMKYVMMERPLDCGVVQRVPVIFPTVLSHDSVAKAVGRGCDEFSDGWNVVSAGFVALDAFVRCYGRSESLGLDSRPDEDGRIIRVFNLEQGIPELQGD